MYSKWNVDIDGWILWEARKALRLSIDYYKKLGVDLNDTKMGEAYKCLKDLTDQTINKPN